MEYRVILFLIDWFKDRREAENVNPEFKVKLSNAEKALRELLPFISC